MTENVQKHNGSHLRFQNVSRPFGAVLLNLWEQSDVYKRSLFLVLLLNQFQPCEKQWLARYVLDDKEQSIKFKCQSVEKSKVTGWVRICMNTHTNKEGWDVLHPVFCDCTLSQCVRVRGPDRKRLDWGCVIFIYANLLAPPLNTSWSFCSSTRHQHHSGSPDLC